MSELTQETRSKTIGSDVRCRWSEGDSECRELKGETGSCTLDTSHIKDASRAEFARRYHLAITTGT